MEAAYTTEALSTGSGREGTTRTTDGKLSVSLAPPVEVGGSGEGTNPEQLFAAGYAACFHSALRSIASKSDVSLEDSSVGARVSLGSNGQGGFELAVHLEVALPHVDSAKAQELAEQAHQVCPYSNATRGNIEVSVTVTDD